MENKNIGVAYDPEAKSTAQEHVDHQEPFNGQEGNDNGQAQQDGDATQNQNQEVING